MKISKAKLSTIIRKMVVDEKKMKELEKKHDSESSEEFNRMVAYAQGLHDMAILCGFTQEEFNAMVPFMAEWC